MTATQSIYLDTGFAIALLSPRDQYHSTARQLAAQLRVNPVRIVATDPVLWQDAFDLFCARADKE